MVKCDEGYLCSVCGNDVESITDSDLYLRFIAGLIDPEVLHTTPERHILCNPVLAQFIVASAFELVVVESEFAKTGLDREFVKAREQLVTRAWLRLQEVAGTEIPIHTYPLPEIIGFYRQNAQIPESVASHTPPLQ